MGPPNLNIPARLSTFVLSQIHDLRQFSSCEVADALVHMGTKKGNVLQGITRISPAPPFPMGVQPQPNWKICGPVVTVKLDTLGNEPAQSNPLRPLDDFVEYNKPGTIMVIRPPDSKARIVSAAWSGLLSFRAKQLGAEGVVVDGNVREVDVIRKLDFPVFARGVAPIGPGVLMIPNKIGAKVDISGVDISATDIILGDDHGVICVKFHSLSRVLETCRKLEMVSDDPEKKMAFLRAGQS